MRRFNCCWCWATLLDAPFQVLLAQGYIQLWVLDAPFQLLLAVDYIIGCAISSVAGAGLHYWMRRFIC
jgi:hypothetical protein